MNTIWDEWYYQDRFLGKPYPFVDNIPRPDIEEGNLEMTAASIPAGKEREIRVGDVFKTRPCRFLTQVTVTKVTADFIWLEYSESYGKRRYIVKRRRDIVLMGTKYY